MTSSAPEDLTSSEIAMIRSAAEGETLDLGQGPRANQPETFKEERVIRAVVLRQLLIDQRWPARSVRLRGAQIRGHLDLTSSVLRCPLYLKECLFDDGEPVTLDYATASMLTLTGCRLGGGVSGEGVTVTESLDLSQSELGGPLVLRRAQVSGWLNCGGAHLKAHALYGDALNAERMSVGDDVLFDEGFLAEGALRLNEARIAGRLVCSGARLAGTDDGGRSLSAANLTVQSDVFFGAGFMADGSLYLNEARIAGYLVCSGARLARDHNGRSLSAAHLAVGNDVFFDAGFTAAGSLRLNDAEIAGQLVCSGARLEQADPTGYSLFAERINVGGNVFLDDRFSATGAVSFSFARIGRSLRIIPENFAEGDNRTAFDGSSMNVASTLLWAPSKHVLGAVSLEGAVASELEDHWTAERADGYWPTGGLLRLNGFVYGRIVGTDQATVSQRLAWIRSQYPWSPSAGPHPKTPRQPIAAQPYSQLEWVYRAAGQDRQATTVAIAMRQDIRHYGDIAFIGRFGNWLMDYTVRYGYQPWRALVSLVAVYVSVVALALIAQNYNAAIVPIPQNAAGIHGTLSAGHCVNNYPCLTPLDMRSTL